MRKRVANDFFNELNDLFVRHGATYVLVIDEDSNTLEVSTNLQLGCESGENESDFYLSEDCFVYRFMTK